MESRSRTIRFGPYLTAALGPVLILFELDFEESKDFASDSTIWKRAGYLELSVVPVQGLDIQVSWDHFDPDLDLKPNTVDRVGIGVEIFPLPFMEFKLLYRHSFADVEVGITDARTFPWAASNGMDEVMFFIHAFL